MAPPWPTVLNTPAFNVEAVRSSSPATSAGIASAPSAKYFELGVEIDPLE